VALLQHSRHAILSQGTFDVNASFAATALRRTCGTAVLLLLTTHCELCNLTT
jgi:hypothetical protein